MGHYLVGALGYSSEKINWESADELSIKKYLKNTDKVLSEINIPVDAICCRDLRCQ